MRPPFEFIYEYACPTCQRRTYLNAHGGALVCGCDNSHHDSLDLSHVTVLVVGDRYPVDDAPDWWRAHGGSGSTVCFCRECDGAVYDPADFDKRAREGGQA